jgi:hypothetical protein
MKILVVLVLALGFAVVSPFSVHHSVSASGSMKTPTATPKPTATPNPQNCQGQQVGNKCCPKGYTTQQCKNMGIGTVSVAIAGTSLTLTGTGTRSTLGSKLAVAKVTLQHMLKGGHAFRVAANGRIPALRLTVRGQLYKYNPATNQWKPVSAVTGAGIYEAVVR